MQETKANYLLILLKDTCWRANEIFTQVSYDFKKLKSTQTCSTKWGFPEREEDILIEPKKKNLY